MGLLQERSRQSTFTQVRVYLPSIYECHGLGKVAFELQVSAGKSGKEGTADAEEMWELDVCLETSEE